MNSRQLDILDEILAPDFARYSEATPDVQVRSAEQFKDFLRGNTQTFPDNVQHFRRVVVEEDMAGFWASYEGTQQGQLGPFPPSGRRVEFSFAGVLRVENGKISELWVTWDNMAILGQLGHLGPPPDQDS